jgi:hypothetical protein
MAKAESSIRRLLRAEAEAWRSIKAPPGPWMLAEFLVRMGIDYIPRPLPARFPRMTPNHCFSNAAAVAQRDPTLSYCEGYITTGGVPICQHHAWVVDAKGRMLEVTLAAPEAWCYIGFPMTMAERNRFAKPNALGVLMGDVSINGKFMTEKCPALLDLIDVRFHRAVREIENT